MIVLIKLIKLSLISVVIFCLYNSKDLLISFFDVFFNVLQPVIFGFTLAYLFYPLLNKITRYVPKFLGTFILIVLLLFIIFIICFNLFDIFYQLTDLLSVFNSYLKALSFDFILVSEVIDILIDYIINSLLANPFATLEITVNIISNFVLTLITCFYFLCDMDKIIEFFNKRKMSFIINSEIRKYFNGFSLIILITFFEYLVLYFLIGHPHFLLIAVIASVGNLIPFFGNFVVSFLALITFNSPLCIFMVIICNLLDNVIINPLVYSKSLKVHPLLIIVSFLIGSYLFGFLGFIFSLPLLIVIIVLIKNLN